ncbi:unknown protein [Azorhizobium caulinodans ORS 571]|uniref:Uncharacterized protein n=1 Tax=Azorhizobium caulinodans (strain ATCC 43989 / DSM 5975 / JCM 20966 / LMG 6465 / NBRC 14845 / NCIMB 13405 / ORS 571) TaxID=438753 RepID=A8IF98_AZOC5|nr:hypothetical protein [Azorhizobium caulinodans]BAF89592.1 unknown protein [Azorhizobium caulinodans ORS 571]
MEPEAYHHPDIICQRATALAELAATVDNTKNRQAREHLLDFMERICRTLQPPRPAELKVINGTPDE